MRMSSRAKIAGFCMLVLALSSAGPVLAEGKIGVAAAVQNEVFGNSQPLSNGSGVFVNEHIRTGDSGMAQLQFLDETNLSVGPKSEVVLDRFVYDPNRGKGSVVVQTGRGVFRFVSGSQDPTSYQIKTPVATIGVRGTVFQIINGSGFTAIIQWEGHTTTKVLATGQVIVLNPGWTLLIYSGGKIEQFQSGDTLPTTLVQQIDPVLVNEFQQLILRLSFLNAIDNPFTKHTHSCGTRC
jgi:ferric-dicitrate binding protein FerR (iron transport regulator)